MSTDLEYGLLDELLSNINQVLFVRDALSENHDIIYVNNAYESLWGRSKQSLIDNPASYIESVHPDDREMVIRLYMQFLEGNIEYEKDFRIIRADGEVRWVFAKTFAIFNDEGNLYRIAGFAEDITSRKETELNINNLNNIQAGVLKMLAHDLRTPIAGIKLTTGLIENSSSEKRKECTQQVLESCDNTLSMMDDLLSHIKMSDEGMTINSETKVIEDELNSICTDFGIQLKEKQLTLKMPSSKTSVELDPIKFKQIISNLLTNAIKFSQPSGLITISIHEHESTVNLSIKDQGIGISSTVLPEVFDIFTRARRKGTLGEKSTGIGLSITKRLVELHEANIEIKSEIDKGTEVCITFPK
jgi:two-component system sensor histidine kinase VicK